MRSVDSLKAGVKKALSTYRLRRDRIFHGSCLVLLYHRVVDLHSDPQQLAVTPDRFDAHLTWLKEHHRVLRVQEFDDFLVHRRKFPRNSILITFDDGYADNHFHARPLLERHGLEALFYITSDYIGSGREYWWDELERMLLTGQHLPSEFRYARNGVDLHWSVEQRKDPIHMRRTYEQMLVALRPIPSAIRDAILGDLRVQLGPEPARSTHLPMSRDELRSFASSPSVVIGAHTRLHPSLGHLNEAEQRAEIAGSKVALEELLGGSVDHFAYPFGTPSDFNATTRRIVQESGFIHAAANHPGIVHARSPRFAFNRLLIRDWGREEFRVHVNKYLG